jgi:hypothetical protein
MWSFDKDAFADFFGKKPGQSHPEVSKVEPSHTLALLKEVLLSSSFGQTFGPFALLYADMLLKGEAFIVAPKPTVSVQPGDIPNSLAATISLFGVPDRESLQEQGLSRLKQLAESEPTQLKAMPLVERGHSSPFIIHRALWPGIKPGRVAEITGGKVT